MSMFSTGEADVLADEVKCLRQENSELKVRDSNVTFHSRNVMAVNEALRKRIAELEGGIVAENRRVTKKIDALVAAGDALARCLTTAFNLEVVNNWEKAKDG